MNPLDAMAEVIRRYGWTRLEAGTINTGFCLLGSWKHVYQYGPYTSRESYQALQALRAASEDMYGTAALAEVNDREFVDVDDALALVEKAAARYAEVHG